MKISQEDYIEESLIQFNMHNSNPVATPTVSNSLGINLDLTVKEQSNLPFRNIVGTLHYLVTCTRPDIASIAIANNPIVKSRVKHVDLRERILNSELSVEYISTANQQADLLTKGLPKETFQRLRSLLGLHVEMGGRVETSSCA